MILKSVLNLLDAIALKMHFKFLLYQPFKEFAYKNAIYHLYGIPV